MEDPKPGRAYLKRKRRAELKARLKEAGYRSPHMVIIDRDAPEEFLPDKADKRGIRIRHKLL